MRLRHFAGAVAAMLFVTAACESDRPTAPNEGTDGVTFEIDGVQHSASGTMASGDIETVLKSEFAVANPDSLEGFAVVSYQPGPNGGDMFVIQGPRQTGTFECSLHSGPCHGRFIADITFSGESLTGTYYHIATGTLTVTEVGPNRLKATFNAKFARHDGSDEGAFTVQNGSIDVPSAPDSVTDGSCSCLLSRIGLGNHACRG